VGITPSPYGFYGKGYTCDIMVKTMVQLLVILIQYLNLTPVWIRDCNRLCEIRLVSNRKVERSGESTHSVRTNRPSIEGKLEYPQAWSDRQIIAHATFLQHPYRIVNEAARPVFLFFVKDFL